MNRIKLMDSRNSQLIYLIAQGMFVQSWRIKSYKKRFLFLMISPFKKKIKLNKQTMAEICFDYPLFGREVQKEFDHTKPGIFQRRQLILRDTLEFFASPFERAKQLELACANVARWKSKVNILVDENTDNFTEKVHVFAGDWGIITSVLTKQYGQIFAVLNMCNAYFPGGGYVEGHPAQEENMFRRTDCHFSVDAEVYSRQRDCYRSEITSLLNAQHGRVMLNVNTPRVCVRGAEFPTFPTLGYAWLPPKQVFPFYELRAAAVNLRMIKIFDQDELTKRVYAQLDTLIEKKVRFVVLSAFGCGAFKNPAEEVAKTYRIAIQARLQHFTYIAFAIHYPGYGPDNITPFRNVFQ